MNNRCLMRIVLMAAVLIWMPVWCLAGPERNHQPEMERQLYVPYDDLNILLDSGTQRVLLSRQEYESLLAEAQQESSDQAPTGALWVAAVYEAQVEDGRAVIAATLTIDVLETGLRAVDLGLSGVGIRHATLGDKKAPLGTGGDGRLKLFIDGVGRHQLLLEIVAPLETRGAQQVLNIQLPTPSATRFKMTVHGDIEVQSGVSIVSRTYDADSGTTRFELLPKRGPMSVVLSRNNRLEHKRSLLIARGVTVAQISEAREILHTTLSMNVLHRPVDRFRFVVPKGFEVTNVDCPHLARWTVDDQDGRSVLEVGLSQPVSETEVVRISSVRPGSSWANWSLSRIQPLDVVSDVSVVGVILDERMNIGAIEEQGLIPIDTRVISGVIPKAALGVYHQRARPVVAYYAPQGAFVLNAGFDQMPDQLWVTTTLLLSLEDTRHKMRGGLTILPLGKDRFSFDLIVPQGWHVTKVMANDGSALVFDQLDPSPASDPESRDAPTRIRVHLPRGIRPNQEQKVYFHAQSRPQGWLDGWESTRLTFPVFGVIGASRERGAIAIDARDDLIAQPESLQHLTPLDENEKPDHGLGGAATDFAYRYHDRTYQAVFDIRRISPRTRARTVSSFRVGSGVLDAHYEIVYEVEKARARRLSLLLPDTTPLSLSITGLKGVKLKEFNHEPAEDGLRRWVAFLSEPRQGEIRLAVDFQQRLDENRDTDFALPVIEAEAVAYQSGLVSIEGNDEIDVRVTDHPRRVDVGELVDARYQPGPRLLGVFGFVGDPEPVKIRIDRHDNYGLPPAIVQRTELATALSANGVNQTAATYLISAKAMFLEILLPKNSSLWTATLNGNPTKPQRDGDRLLLDLSKSDQSQLDKLTIVFETAIDSLNAYGVAKMQAPKLVFHTIDPSAHGKTTRASNATKQGGASAAGHSAVAVPVADLQWDLYLPPGYAVTHCGGTVTAVGDVTPPLAAHRLLGWLTQRGREDRLAPSPQERAVQSALTQLERVSTTTDSLTLKKTSRADERKNQAALSELSQAVQVFSAGQSTRTPGRKSTDELLGMRSLKIDLERSGRHLRFQSLGVEPQLEVTLLDQQRLNSAAWGVAGIVLLGGLALAGRVISDKAWYVVGICLAATLPPLIFGRTDVVLISNAAFYAAAFLAPLYVMIALAVAIHKRWIAFRPPMGTVAALILALGIVSPLAGGSALASQVDEPDDHGPPVHVPDDAVILPYDSKSGTGIKDADSLLIPYQQFVELWNLAHPDRRIGDDPPPTPFTMAGGGYTATLEVDSYLLFKGRFDIEVYVDTTVQVPMPLEGGVLAGASLDGKPARLSVAETNAPRNPQAIAPSDLNRSIQRQRAVQPAHQSTGSLVVLHVNGRGRHRLDLEVRVPLTRQGGWRAAQVRLPAAAATAMNLIVPDLGTEVRIEGLPDRPVFETNRPGQRIETALGINGVLSIRWRPKISSGQVDRGMRSNARVVFDVQEGQLRSTWQFFLEFPRNQQDQFTVQVPEDYLVESVEGPNVRGWRKLDAEDQHAVRVSLLQAARDRENFVIRVRRQRRAGVGDLSQITAPVLTIQNASAHSGTMVIRRSPRLTVRTVESTGVARTDMPREEEIDHLAGTTVANSLLGVHPFEAYRFVTNAFKIRMKVAPTPTRQSARTQTILRLEGDGKSLESRIVVTLKEGMVYRVRVVIPDQLELEHVSAPGPFEWSVSDENHGRVLTLVLGAGQRGQVPIVITGKVNGTDGTEAVMLPRFKVLGVDRQEGDLVVQADPATDVTVRDLVNCQSVLMSRVYDWLEPAQRALARLAIHYQDPNYSGTLVLADRVPDVSCQTVTSIRVTDRAIEETILLDLHVRDAGVREVVFLVPDRLADAKISVPLLRQKTVAAVEANPQWARVKLELQDAVIGRLRVLIEDDRLLRYDTQQAPIPIVETGRTDQRFVTLENLGRDEAVVESHHGLEPLNRQQAQRHALARLLASGAGQSYVASNRVAEPRFAFRANTRQTVTTAGARIGLAQTLLVLDPSGAYRAAMVYRVDNSTEQFLEVELPPDAQLWTARVAGEPVKPARSTNDQAPPRVRIPLIKTAPGELDYEVVLKYAGRIAQLDRLTAVSFPLIQSININVELSQARLYLPQTHRWFDFGGSMGRVTQAGDLEAGFLSYKTRQVKRLVETLQDDNAYAQVRASRNIADLKKELGAYQSRLGSYAGNEELKRQQASQSEVLELAQREAQRLEPKPRGLADVGNRARLYELWTTQQNARSAKVIEDMGANFEAQADQQPAIVLHDDAQDGDSYSHWFKTHHLDSEEQPTSRRGEKAELVVPEGLATSKKSSTSQRNVQPEAPTISFQGQSIQEPEQLGFVNGRLVDLHTTGEVKDVTEQNKAFLYGQKLDSDRRQSNRRKGDVQGAYRPTEEFAMAGILSEVGRDDVDGDAILGGTGRAGGLAGGGVMATGLVSLDVDIPVRGVEYRFTTPRGKVEITARAVSRSMLDASRRLGAYVMVVVAILGLVRVISRFDARSQRRPVVELALVSLGGVSFLTGILPAVGIMAAVVGVLMTIHRRSTMAAVSAPNGE